MTKKMRHTNNQLPLATNASQIVRSSRVLEQGMSQIARVNQFAKKIPMLTFLLFLKCKIHNSDIIIYNQAGRKNIYVKM